MNYAGSGRRLALGDIGDAARAVRLPTAAILAILEVEAAGRGFDARNRPKILPEGHVFYRVLKRRSSALLNKAINLGLAWRKWRRDYPKYSDDRYDRLDRMAGVHEESGLRACSWGLPQILGENYEAAGFKNAKQMVSAMVQGEREQLIAMVTLIADWGLADKIRGKDLNTPDAWRPFAKRYNGSSYAVHNYHGRLAASYVKHEGRKEEYAVPADAETTFRRGMKGEAVRALQADLAALGYQFADGLDGRFGPETEANVRQVQQDNRLKIDGIAGPATLNAIASRLKDAPEAPETTPEWDRKDGWLPALIQAVLAIIARLFERS